MNLEDEPLSAATASAVPETPSTEPAPVMIPFPPELYPSVEHLIIDNKPVMIPFPPELYPSVDHLILDDGKPVDNLFFEKLMRLLTEALYSSWNGPGEGRPFLVCADVGLFFEPKQSPLAPDIMLSLDVSLGNLSEKENRSYFLWIMGKPPDAIIEFVSDRTGGELTHKMRRYAQIGVAYYVVYDPKNILKQGPLQAFTRLGTGYQPIDPAWMPGICLGLRLWEGEFEGSRDVWLRWCDREGNVIPTGAERSKQEKQRADDQKQRADDEKQRADRLAERLRALGIDPEKLEPQ